MGLKFRMLRIDLLKMKSDIRARRLAGLRACFLCFSSYWSPGYGYGRFGVWYGLYLTGLGWKSLYF